MNIIFLHFLSQLCLCYKVSPVHLLVVLVSTFIVASFLVIISWHFLCIMRNIYFRHFLFAYLGCFNGSGHARYYWKWCDRRQLLLEGYTWRKLRPKCYTAINWSSKVLWSLLSVYYIFYVHDCMTKLVAWNFVVQVCILLLVIAWFRDPSQCFNYF